MSFISGNVPLVMVVEYLQSSMSTELLTKFPDNSAFDFDYSQSTIWSPLLRRFQPEFTAGGGGGLELSRKLSFGENSEVGLLENTKRMAARIKKRFADVVIDNVCRFRRMKRRNSKSFGFSPLPSSSSPKPKAWDKVMKAAAKHFKKRKRNNSGNGNVRLDFSNYMDYNVLG